MDTPSDVILPMEPVYSSTIPDGEEWIAQIKWDGVRLLSRLDGQSIHMWNRKSKDRTHHYPELHDTRGWFQGNSALVDGEMIALGSDGKPDFHRLMRRDGLRRLDKVKMVAHEVPVVYMVFDILQWNGKWLLNTPLRTRMDILEACITDTAHVQRVQSVSDTVALFQVTQSHQLEGIVCKRVNSLYYLGQKRDDWKKTKNYQDLCAVVGGYSVNDVGQPNALAIGVYVSSSDLMWIAQVGPGCLSSKEWSAFLKDLHRLETPNCPFTSSAGPMNRHLTWVQPLRTVKVQYMEWHRGASLRQPLLLATDIYPPDACVFDNTMVR